MIRRKPFPLIATLLVLVFYAILVAGSDPSSRVDQVDVISQSAEDTVYTDANGDPDYGKKVKVVLRNRGSAGTITLAVILSSSEGRWKKQTSIRLENGETGYAYLDFPEPSIAANDIIISKIEVVSVE